MSSDSSSSKKAIETPDTSTSSTEGNAASEDSLKGLSLEEKQKKREELKQERKWQEEDARKKRGAANAEWAADTKNFTADELAARGRIVMPDRPTGMPVNTHHFDFDPAAARGPSQIVTYSSRFVDKLSDITDDMNISGSLSIKYGAIGGSGRGAFVDSDKFKDSDLNFYISVKVISKWQFLTLQHSRTSGALKSALLVRSITRSLRTDLMTDQTMNFKDALDYHPVASVNAGSK